MAITAANRPSLFAGPASPYRRFDLHGLRWLVGLLCAVPVTLLAQAPFASPAAAVPNAGVGLTIALHAPATVTVGQSSVPASLTLSATAALPVAITEIAVDAPCIVVPGGGCAAATEDFVLSPIARGAGTGCPGTRFIVSGPDANGRYVFVPTSAVVLLPLPVPGVACTISYTFDVAMAVGGPRLQLAATLAGFETLPLLSSTSRGTSVIDVNRAVATISSIAMPASAPVDAPIGDRAGVAAPLVGPQTPGPTGTVTFSSYGPDDANCTRAPAFSAPDRPLESGQAATASFIPQGSGTYRWIASYSGDENFAPATSMCADPQASTTVGKAPVLVTATSHLASDGVTPTATAILTGGANPSGSVTFRFFGPDDAGCRNSPDSSAPAIPVRGDDSYSVLVSGDISSNGSRFVAHYNGDGNNRPASSQCTALAMVAPVPGSTTLPAAPLPKPRLHRASPPPPVTGLAVYDPTAHPRQVVSLEVSAFALLSTVGASAGAAGAAGVGAVGAVGGGAGGGGAGGGGAGGSGPGGSGGAQPSSSGSGSGGSRASGSTSQGYVVSAGVDNTGSGWTGVSVTDVTTEGVKWGDRSWTWRWPGTRYTDRVSRELPERAAPKLPLVARVLNDAGYLRAMFGSTATLFPIVGVALGIVAVVNVHGHALPPQFWWAMALAALGVFDALAGFVAVVVFVGGVIALGGLSSPNAARTLLGLSALWFVAPIIAGSARPLRREPTLTPAQHFDRFADVVIASLVGAWAVQQIVRGLPGLAGLALPIAAKANEAALIVLGALAARMVIETVAAHQYPRRLGRVQQADLPGSSVLQHLGATMLTLTIFLFVAVSYMGSCWQLYVGGVLFLIPPLLRLRRHRFPNSPALHARLPKGIVSTVLLLVIGALLSAVVFGLFHNHRELIRDSFVLLSLPGFALSILGLFGRDGPERELHWHHQVVGALVLTTGVLFVLGVFSF